MWSLFSGEGVVFHALIVAAAVAARLTYNSSAPVTQTDMGICSDRDARAADAATH